MELEDIAHARTGDKGNLCNISIIPYSDLNYQLLKDKFTSDCVKEFFKEICLGNVIRYEIDSICSLNFVL